MQQIPFRTLPDHLNKVLYLFILFISSMIRRRGEGGGEGRGGANSNNAVLAVHVVMSELIKDGLT